MEKGIFYGIGAGPGDPELLTLKAVRILEGCPVIAAPRTKSGEMLALDIVRQAVSLEGKEILPLFFSMERDPERQRQAHEIAAGQVEERLAAGQDVAMLNLGDVSIYATYSYLMEILSGRGYRTVMVPGVPSFCAVAARLGTSLTAMDAPLHILPAGAGNLEELLSLPGTKVLMKSGRRMLQAVEALEAQGLLDQARMVQNCGLPGEQICEDLREASGDQGYFSTIVVKP